MAIQPANDDNLDQHLTALLTPAGDLRVALDAQGSLRLNAQTRVIQYYQRAVYKYVLALLGDVHKADDVFQDFALRFVRGDFRSWDAARGRFRDYLKTSLRNLAMDRFRKRKKDDLQPLPEGLEPAAADLPDAEADRVFLQSWSEEAMRRAWDALRRFEQETGQPVHTVLRRKSEQPDLRSHQVAERLTAELGRPTTAGWVRKWLALAREKFAELLLTEVERSLPEPSADELEREIAELGLLQYCRKALEQRRQQPGK
jgi:RNA polymerase sigma factor (sigma-70 family)